MNNHYQPEGMLLSNCENHEFLSSRAGLEKALEKQRILESVALLCDGDFNLHFDLYGIPGIFLGIPLFAVLSKLGSDYLNDRLERRRAAAEEKPAEDPEDAT